MEAPGRKYLFGIPANGSCEGLRSATVRESDKSDFAAERLQSCRQIGMYGPPLRRKRNLRMPQVGLRKCIRPLLEWITPGQDGMRCALFPINWSVLRDHFRFRV